ncbi:MAG: tape measure protein [Armatimonadetes bacterium]|nr:tape measure protein [Armatimonadota bacterium]
MPEKEFYRLEIGIGVTGTEKTKSELKAMERFVEQTRKRGEMLNRMRISPTVRLIDRISGPARRIEANLNRLSGVHRVTIEAMDRTTNVVRRITGTLTSPLTMLGAGAGMAGLIGYPLKLAGEMDRAQNSILNYSASIEEGRKNFEELVAFALKSPVYDVPFVAQMGGRLLAVTKDINFTKRALEAFGNSMLFTGASLDDVKFAFRGFQQIASKGKLQMEELYQVTENLNIPLQWVQDQLGITGDQLSDLGRLGIPARRAMEGIVRVLETRFPKANFNEDLLALATNIKETSRTILWYFGQGMKPAFLRILQCRFSF